MTPEVQNLRLLILDDDESISFTVALIARQIGFETHATKSAAEFFRLLADVRPTHTIIDLVMPEIDGIEIIRRMAGTGSESAIIVASGLGARVVEAAGRAASENGLEVAGVLSKPFTPTQLRNLLQLPRKAAASRPAGLLNGSGMPFEISRSSLKEALNKEQLEVYYQPKIACASGQVMGFECLVRWNHPEAGIITPEHFVPLAEYSGLIDLLTIQVCRQSLAWFAASFLGSHYKIALNISARTLADSSFPDWIVRQCQTYKVPPEQVVLEVTETSSMENPVETLEILTQFRIKGFSLSIDDFGIGYSSLIQLARLPFSEMKIDKMFVITAPQSEESQKIAAAIVGLARALGLKVTAEGVEEGWSLNFLREIGCDYAQGFLFARPMDGRRTLQWLAEWEAGARDGFNF